MAELDDFEISDRDFEDAINPGGGRQKMTKEQAIYGIWAEDDFDQKISGKNIKFAPESGKRSASSKKHTKKAKTVKEEFGSWEKHTTGFGSKMLEKMGFKQGQGLGKRASGIVEPVQAVVRQGRAALGAYGSEKIDQTIQLSTADASITTQIPDLQPEPVKAHWKKSLRSDQKYIKKTFEQLLKETKNSSSMSSFVDSVKVVDMTGPETRVSFGYDSIVSTQKIDVHPQKNLFDLPELIHNVEVLQETTEKSLRSLIKKVQIRRDHSESINFEYQSLVSANEIVTEELSELETLINSLELLEDDISQENDYFKKANIFFNSYQYLLLHFSSKFEEFSLDSLVRHLLYPILTRLFNEWNFFEDPEYPISVIVSWRTVISDKIATFDDDENFAYDSRIDVYQKTLSDIILPKFVKAIDLWEPKMMQISNILNLWKPLLTEYIWNMICKKIANRLQIEIEKWRITDSKTVPDFMPNINIDDTVLEAEMGDITKTFVKRFIKNSQIWHPSDASLKSVFTLWKDLLTEDQINLIMNGAIAPRLLEYLDKEFIVNPRNQVLDPLNHVLMWKDQISLQKVSLMLSKGFGMKWLKILCLWMENHPIYEDVKKWYSGWKSIFSEFITYPAMQHIFNQALDIIDKSIQGLPLPTPTPFTEKAQVPSQKSSSSFSLTFKELVARTASDNGLIFNPIPRRRPDGKTIYQFGSKLITIDRDVIFVGDLGNERWKPISLEELVQISNNILFLYRSKSF